MACPQRIDVNASPSPFSCWLFVRIRLMRATGRGAALNPDRFVV
jgi:hypothetical protein